ncbi:manganese transport protein MntH [Polystyrenella longa]|uniref:Manganese transport protein MntH n=1 Tax=Polystyrenella longa TaxID=2528007 RepID=A0A518CUC4_9PLAN|nr:Nramp family divalent metal transporter [Polystyrenella longa]QDU82808.1 manganese transport protein MntH [Polystyrenella longa]
MSQPPSDEQTHNPATPENTVEDLHVQDPPTRFLGIVKQLGPGLIIASAIVGSGELIATTKTGAQAGLSLLWLIFFGCLIKVFVQIELGRFTISEGQTSLAALNSVPGPRLKINWIIWVWFAMMLTSMAQLGGIVGGVGQAAAIALPITGDYAEVVRAPSEKQIDWYLTYKADRELADQTQSNFSQLPPVHQERAEFGMQYLETRFESLRAEGYPIDELISRVDGGETLIDPNTWDDRLWALLVTIFTAILLYLSRYNLIQTVAMVLVVSFTLITIGNVISLQATEYFSVTFNELMSGLAFKLPEPIGGIDPVKTAIATFGIIGVGASELIAYPYWCQEKGYAKFTGPRQNSDAWSNRAKGWLRVMRFDAFNSMIIYTIATMAFYFMGATVLFRQGLDPDGMRMVTTLSSAYVPIFGNYARWLFLIGAIAVLYSTFLVANASNARMWSDFFRIAGLFKINTEEKFMKCVGIMSVVLPCISFCVFASRANPVTTVLIAGMMQSIMLPMIGFAALYFRYKRIDRRLRPGLVWDIFLILSFLGLLVTGSWGLIKVLTE